VGHRGLAALEGRSLDEPGRDVLDHDHVLIGDYQRRRKP
jgi:hypothetical protein